MHKRIIAGLLIGSSMLVSLPADALQCVPYAREHSGISIRGDAWTWWSSAAGVYDRGHAPRIGAVVVFKKHGSMRHGHVAVVTQVLGSRHVMVDHANWASRRGGHRGQISRNMAVVDVSPRNDWTQVRVWNLSTQDYGTKVYPTYGFIYANDEDDAPQPAARLQNASYEVRGGGMMRMPQEQISVPDQRLISALVDLDPVPQEKVEVKALEVKQVEVKAADIKVEVKESKAESKSAAAHPAPAPVAAAPAKVVVAKAEPAKVEVKADVKTAAPAAAPVEEDGDAALAKRFGSGRY